MSVKQAVDKEPCMPLSLAKKIIASSKKALKQSEQTVKRLSELGIDVSSFEEELKHGQAAERLASMLFKEAKEKEKSE